MTNEIREALELVRVETEDNSKAVLTFLDEEREEIREVIFNKNAYKDGKFVPDQEKAEKVEQWCAEHFDLTFETLGQAVGEKRDIYCYDNFNSLFEVKMIAKFDEDMIGQIMNVEVSKVIDDGQKIAIQFEYESETYESKMSYADYLESRKDWFVNPQKRAKQYKKFEEKFHIPIKEKESLIGKIVMIEVKKAMGKYVYIEIKPFPKKK